MFVPGQPQNHMMRVMPQSMNTMGMMNHQGMMRGMPTMMMPTAGNAARNMMMNGSNGFGAAYY